MEDKLIVLVDDDPNLIDPVSTYLAERDFLVKSFQNASDLFKFLD